MPATLATAGPEVQGARLLLDDPDSVWLIEQGQVDLFAVERHADAAVGVRRFLWTAAAPAVVLGLALAPGDRRVGLMAVRAVGTRIRRIPVSAIRARAEGPDSAADVGALVETFVAQAREAIRRASVPPLSVRFPAAETVTVYADQGTEAWREAAAWDGLARFQLLLADWLAHYWSAVGDAERARLARKAGAERQMVASGMVGLAGVLADTSRAIVPERSGDSLLAACRAVGAHAGITFQPAPAWEVERRVRDPLASICRASRVRHRRVALREGWWRLSGRPLLGTIAEDGRPVALLPAGSARYELFDPARGVRVAVDQATSASLAGEAFEFYRPSPATRLTLVDLGRLALEHARGDLSRLFLAALAGGLLGLALPIATGKVFSEIIPMALPANIAPLLATLVSFTLASTFFDLTQAMALIRIEGRTTNALQATIIDRLLALPVPFFRAYAVGDLTLRANGINAVRNLLSGAVVTSILEGFFSIVSLALLLYYSRELTVVAIGVLIVSVIFTATFAAATIRVERRRQAVDGKLAGLVFEMIGGIAKLRVAGAEQRAFAIWARRFREERDLAFRAGTYENFVTVFNDVLPVLAKLALLGTTGYLLTRGTALNTGDFVAFNAAFGSFVASGSAMSDTLIRSLNIIPLMERAQPILEATLETPAARPDPGELTGRIEVSHVTFRHQADGPAILRDVSLHAEPGEFIALVGPSGAGKSTLLRLLLGFEPPESGAIYFDDHDLALVDLTAIRSQMGVVLQTSRLLAGDIAQNIIGSSPLTIADAWHAAEMAGLAPDVREMPMAMHTVVSEGGSTLSGGQRQRLLIARALVRRPRLVLFDEATSALDNRAQDVVSRSLEHLKATRIVIAHRLSTVRHAHRIYVMEAGRVVQQGSYEELAHAPGLFATMVARQLV